MRFFLPTRYKILLTLFLIFILSPWYIGHVDTLVNPYHLPSCWNEVANGSKLPTCASPFRSFTFGVPIALVAIVIFYILVCLVVYILERLKTKRKSKTRK